MSDYQKVEVSTGEQDGGAAFSEEDTQYLEQKEAQQAQEAPERPAWLPEKFESAEAMAEAYAALESQFTQTQQSDSKPETAADSTADSTEEMGVGSFAEYTAEFTNTGDVSEESRQKLVDDFGLPREMIDGYVEGQKALLNEYYSDVFDSVGGEENYNSMLGWAAENLPEGEQQAFNQSVVEGTRDQMMFAVKSLASRWASETGGSPKPLIQGSTGFEGAAGGFRSLAELTSAMKDKRYQSDPAYRRDVEKRLQNSNIL